MKSSDFGVFGFFIKLNSLTDVFREQPPSVQVIAQKKGEVGQSHCWVAADACRTYQGASRVIAAFADGFQVDGSSPTVATLHQRAPNAKTNLMDSDEPPHAPRLSAKGSGSQGNEDVEHSAADVPTPLKSNHLHRGLSTRQVSMIAIAGTIGTGLFLGTGRSLAQGGPASMLICYGVVGFVVYITLLLLGEMATQYPVAGEHFVILKFTYSIIQYSQRPGSFNAYAVRFFSPSYGFALSWNYWFNDAVSVASDLTAAQLVLQFWTTQHPWVISLLFWVFLVVINAVHVRTYGELGKWSLFVLSPLH